jgi:hypothetical protein
VAILLKIQSDSKFVFKRLLGEYHVDVFYGNQLINGSPFKIKVCDPNKIKVTPALFGLVNQAIRFEGKIILNVLYY